jgi:hypothetical protein
VALGCLVDSEVDDALLFQLVNAIRTLLDARHLREGNEMILNGLIYACTKVVGARLKNGYTGPESLYLHELFWLAVSILEIADDETTYPLALAYVETCLKALALNSDLERHHLPTYLLRYRGSLEPEVNALDRVVGVDFSRSFSFAMAAFLTKGIRLQSSRELVKSTIDVLFELASKRRLAKLAHAVREGIPPKPTIPLDLLPHLVILALITPVSDFVNYLTMAGLAGEEYRNLPYDQIWRKLFENGSLVELEDDATALLFLSLTEVILNFCHREEELLILYTLFNEAAPHVKDSFACMYVSVVVAC